MISRVIISPKLVAEFRTAAKKAYPNEVLRTLWGRVQGDSIIVSSLRDLPQQADQDEVRTSYGDMHGLEPREAFLGSIHSHPDAPDAAPSEYDWQDAFKAGEHVFGVMQINREDSKFTTTLRFWPTMPSVAIIYPRQRKTWNPKRVTSPSAQNLVDMSPTSPDPERGVDVGIVST